MLLRERIRQALTRPPDRLDIPGFAATAVLVPLVERGGVVTVTFTLRLSSLPTHAGQIAFPGGHREPDDVSPAATALREAEEEIGIVPEAVQILGRLDDVATPTGFVITPVVGWLIDPAPFRIDPREVAEAFEVPFAALAAPGACRDGGTRTIAGRAYVLPEYHVRGRRIWGATARMVQRLLICLKNSASNS